MNGTKEIKRKGKPLGVKPSKQKAKANDDNLTIVRKELTLKQKIIITWMNKATIASLTSSSKQYKEKQLEFVLEWAGKFGKQFPQDVLDCALAKKDIATLLRSGDDEKT